MISILKITNLVNLVKIRSNMLQYTVRGEKLRKKWERDAAQEVRMAVFRIEDMTDPSIKFKVNMNAQ